jgi:acetylornithine deacetylase
MTVKADAIAKDLEKAIAERRTWAVHILSGWVRHASVLGQETPAQEYIAKTYENLGLEVKRLPIDFPAIASHPGSAPVDWTYDGRYNVVGIHEPGGKAGKSLVFNGHVDVVSAEPRRLWTLPPFEPDMLLKEEDGEDWMSARGAGDMKGGSVCALWALAAMQDLGLEPASQVQFQSVLEEECTGNGALSLIEQGYTADACIIPEPFDFSILTHQVGVLWFQTRVMGRTTHVLGAGSGVNAIEKSWLLISALRELEKELNDPAVIPPAYKDVEHPINLNVGVIRGGDWASTVAGECVTRFRLALFPGQSIKDLKARVEDCVRRAAQKDPFLRENPPAVEYVGFQAEGCTFDPKSPLGTTLTKVHKDLFGKAPKHLPATATTDARMFNLYSNCPATCYGPTARNIHGVDEKVSIDSMQKVAHVFARFMVEWCGAKKK